MFRPFRGLYRDGGAPERLRWREMGRAEKYARVHSLVMLVLMVGTVSAFFAVEFGFALAVGYVASVVVTLVLMMRWATRRRRGGRK